jgi:DNA-directed RNA polymerase
MILDRLSALYRPSAPEIVDAHNIFLQTLFDLAQDDPKAASMRKIEDWYNTNMVRRGIEPNAHTFVTLLRAAMNYLDESAQEAAVRKYVALAHEYGEDMVDEINRSPEFSDDEWDTLIRAQPEAFDEPPPVEQVQEQVANAPHARKSLMEHGLPPDFIQHIKPETQKGFGLQSLQQSLAMFADGQDVPYPHEMEGTQEEKDQAYAYMRQLRMEQDALEAAVERWRHEEEKLQKMGVYGVLNTKPIQALMYNWYSALVPLFKKHIARCKEVLSDLSTENISHPAQTYGPWLEQCKPEKLAAITISRVVLSCVSTRKEDSGGSLKVSAVTTAIGNDIRDYLNADAQSRRDAFVRKQRKQFRTNLTHTLAKTKPTSDMPANQPAPDELSFQKSEIPLAVRVEMGALALELLIQSSTITVTADEATTGKQLSSTQAAFSHHIGYQSGKKIGFIAPHHQILSKLRNESVRHVDAVHLPMVIEPKPWSTFDTGGYYTTQQKVVRQKNSDTAQKAYAHSAIQNGDMSQVLAGLDVLGRVPWQINAPIFEVMAQAWNKGEGIAGLIAESSDLVRPDELGADATFQQRAKWGKQNQEYENIKAGLHSQRCFQNFQLEIARAYVKEKRIFFPHSVDFRGRAYPIPPILNHIGADLARGLLRFANGKELGAVGLQWLKIHLANLYGYDKASLKEREQFTTNNLDEIYDSAIRPLEGRRWWTKAEDPWQCLACCMELKMALDLPDPTRFVSQLPVHQDGTCNGLQHYAALGGDNAGARQVNLEPSDRPQDIYTGVAELVREMVAKEAAEGVTLAKFIQGHITRKVVKRTVMTNVYGVTFMGAKKQVHDELRNMFPNFRESDTVRSLGSVALYIAFKIFEALGKIFNGAQEIQYWLGECGERITTSITPEQIKKIRDRYEGQAPAYDSKFKAPKKFSSAQIKKFNLEADAFKTSIIWTTPLKMPIVQPYRKDSVQKVKTNIQKITVVKRSSHDVVDKRKQLQAFPPNFIHSLDATHMILSALKCSEVGLDFAAVHDSFWTHACDIPNLNAILRDAFVRMHSEDIIERLAEEFRARYAGHMYRATIHTTSDVAVRIRRWRLAYSKYKVATLAAGVDRTTHAAIDEVALEAKRQEFLRSEDPAEVAKGKEMVTPTSIWLDDKDPKALSSFRLSLLGETKEETSTKYDDMRDRVLEREAEVIAESQQSPAPIPDEAEQIEALETPNEPPKKSAKDRNHHTQIWVPLTFPPVPQKGGWDVSRLRESKYFFS